ncbi:MAG: hypothetical protein ACKO37_05765 [Vampirovibrionales bacterium]
MMVMTQHFALRLRTPSGLLLIGLLLGYFNVVQAQCVFLLEPHGTTSIHIPSEHPSTEKTSYQSIQPLPTDREHVSLEDKVCLHLNHLLGIPISSFNTENTEHKPASWSQGFARPSTPESLTSQPIHSLPLGNTKQSLKATAIEAKNRVKETLQTTQETLQARITRTSHQWLIDTQKYRYWVVLSPSWLNTSAWEQPQKGLRSKMYEWLYDQPIPQQNMTQWLTWQVLTTWKLYKEPLKSVNMSSSKSSRSENMTDEHTDSWVSLQAQALSLFYPQSTATTDDSNGSSTISLVESGTSITSFPMDLYSRLNPSTQKALIQQATVQHARQVQLDIERHWRTNQVPLKPLRVLERIRQEVKSVLK